MRLEIAGKIMLGVKATCDIKQKKKMSYCKKKKRNFDAKCGWNVGNTVSFNVAKFKVILHVVYKITL